MSLIKFTNFIIIFAFLVFTVSCKQAGSSRFSYSHDVSPSEDCRIAISLAEELLSTLKEPNNYKLISVENLYLPTRRYLGPHLWHLTFKLKDLIPKEDKKPVGLGGEIFIQVDMSTKKAKLLGYGE
jgi:hypothetical protein